MAHHTLQVEVFLPFLHPKKEIKPAKCNTGKVE
jgi:hypothetical protein